jgi:hypothetical protein
MIVDSPNNCTAYLHALKANGVTGIIRYDDRFSTWKQIQPAEARAIANAGMQLGIVYEHTANPSGYSLGYGDAAYSLAMATHRGQTSGAIYYAVDHDASVSDINNNIIPYFQGIYQAHHENQTTHLKIGAYCSGLVATRLLERWPDILSWITCSTGFAGSADFVHRGLQTLWQQHCDRTLAGLDVDINLANKADWGQFTPFGQMPSPTPIPTPPANPWPNSYGPQDVISSWYSDATNASGTPVNNATDMTAASRTIPFGTRIKVTRKDTGATVVVAIQDRGPYAGGRGLDLRPAPARILDMIDAGIISVHMELD